MCSSVNVRATWQPPIPFSYPLAAASWAQALCAYSRQSSVRQQPPKLAADGPSSGEEPKSSSQAEQPDEHDARRGQQQRELAMGELLDSNTTERCPRESSFCYSLWQEDPANKTTLLIITQGTTSRTSGRVHILARMR